MTDKQYGDYSTTLSVQVFDGMLEYWKNSPKTSGFHHSNFFQHSLEKD